MTRLLLTSRPFLVGQMYATDTGNIQNDSAPNDGGLLWHLNHEIQDLGVFKSPIGAHPKIADKPFRGVHLLRMRVRPPAPSGGVTKVEVGQIQASFQFTARSGVGVEVVPADDGVDLVVVLNSVNYTPFPLPPRSSVSITKGELGDASALITLEQFLELLQFNVVDTVIAENALSDGVQTDRYALPYVDVLDRSHAVPFVSISNIPGGQGVIVNDGQPFGVRVARDPHPPRLGGRLRRPCRERRRRPRRTQPRPGRSRAAARRGRPMTALHSRARLYMTGLLAAFSAAATVLLLAQPAWIEGAFGVDPDGGSGSTEALLAAGLVIVTVALVATTGREWMRVRRATA